MDWLATERVDCSDRDPVTGDGTSTHENKVTDGNVVEDLVNAVALGVTDGCQDGSVVETDTVESNVEEEPGASSSEKNLSVLPLSVVAAEVAPRCLGDLHTGCGVLHGGDTSDLVGVALGLGREVGLDIGASLDNIARDIEGVAGGLGDSQTVVESNAARHGTETDDHAPHLVDSNATDAAALVDSIGGEEGLLEAGCDNKRHDTSSKLADTLHGEDGAHHGTAPLGGCEFGCDDGAEGVVTSNANC